MTADGISRRRFVSGGLAAAVTSSVGCLGASDERSDPPRVLLLRLSRETTTLRDRFVTDLTTQPPPWGQTAFLATVAGRTYTTQQRQPFYSRPENPVYAVHEGTYYQLGSVIVGEATATRPVIRLFEDDKGPALDSSKLPTGDVQAVRIAHMAARARGNEGGAPWGIIERGGYVYRNETAVDNSRLLSEEAPETVSYRDRSYRVEITNEQFHEPVYRATAEPVANSAEEMEAVLRGRYVKAQLSSAALSPTAQQILRTAQADGYSESLPYSKAYESVLQGLHRRAYLDGNIRKDSGVDASAQRLVAYDDHYYDYHLSFQPASSVN